MNNKSQIFTIIAVLALLAIGLFISFIGFIVTPREETQAETYLRFIDSDYESSYYLSKAKSLSNHFVECELSKDRKVFTIAMTARIDTGDYYVDFHYRKVYLGSGSNNFLHHAHDKPDSSVVYKRTGHYLYTIKH